MSQTKSAEPLVRIGFGTDIHELVSGEGIPLGGVLVPCAYGCKAVSDGDVLLHALVDALLGACGWGDIGEWFPPHKVAAGQASGVFVRDVMARMAAEGARPVNVDCTVDLEVVRLAEWKGEIRDAVAALLGIPRERVNVKAKTAEKMGPVGEGRAVASQVVVLVAVKE